MASKKNSPKDAFKKSAVKINASQTARTTKTTAKKPAKKPVKKPEANRNSGGYSRVWGGGCSTMRINQRNRGGW